jgi:hypothetical protein
MELMRHSAPFLLGMAALAGCTAKLRDPGFAGTEAALPNPAAIQAGETPYRFLGIYEFVVRHGGGEFIGTLLVSPTSMAARPTSGGCEPARNGWSATVQRFDCDGLAGVEKLTLLFDIQNPKDKSRWSGTVTGVARGAEQCVQYTTTASGQRQCIRTQATASDYSNGVGGAILVKSKETP